MAVASRYVKNGGAQSWSAGRRLLSRLGCWFSRPLTPVRDAMSGFFLMRRDRAAGFTTTTQGFKIGLELLVRTQPRHLAEVGYVFVGREAGESKMSVGEAFRFLRQLGRLYAYSWSASAARPSYLVVSEAPSRRQSGSAIGA
jgi:dolichol-phosphate mannosyltransferase